MSIKSLAYARSDDKSSTRAWVRLAIVGCAVGSDEVEAVPSFSIDAVDKTERESDGDGVDWSSSKAIDSSRAARDASLALCDGMSST